MLLRKLLNEHKNNIEKELEKFFYKKVFEFKDYDSRILQAIYNTQNFILRGGKRLRSFLANISYTGFGGKRKVFSELISLELLHCYLLIHDDIMDKDEVRYGGPTIWKYYFDNLEKTVSSEQIRYHFSFSLALLVGNVLNAFISEPIGVAKWITPEKKHALLKLLEVSQYDTSFGQLLDMYSSITFPSKKQILEVYRLKTGIYSIAVPLRFGAHLASKNSSDLDFELMNFAEPLGIAFQIYDDILGVFGDSKVTGKSSSNDLIQKKKTYLLLKTIELLSEKEKNNFLEIFNKKQLNSKDVQKLKKTMIDSGALQYAKDKIIKLTSKSKKVLKKIPMRDKEKEILEQFTNFITQRDK